MTSGETFARRASFKRALNAAFFSRFVNPSKVNSGVTIAAPDYKAHIVTLFSQFGVQDFNVGFQVIVSVSAHGLNIAGLKSGANYFSIISTTCTVYPSSDSKIFSLIISS